MLMMIVNIFEATMIYFLPSALITFPPKRDPKATPMTDVPDKIDKSESVRPTYTLPGKCDLYAAPLAAKASPSV